MVYDSAACDRCSVPLRTIYGNRRRYFGCGKLRRSFCLTRNRNDDEVDRKRRESLVSCALTTIFARNIEKIAVESSRGGQVALPITRTPREEVRRTTRSAELRFVVYFTKNECSTGRILRTRKTGQCTLQGTRN